jgi:Zn-finger nucleic acid-binding protein
MICPNCGETLRERERSGIEIDICPVCRGVWLDRGELDKLIDRESRYEDEDDDDDFDRDRGRREPEYAREGARSSDREYRDSGRRDQPPQKKKGFFQSLVETFGEGGEGGMGD